MKKAMWLLLGISLVLFGCKEIERIESDEIKITENSIEKVYFTKDSSEEFKNFLKLPESRKCVARSLENGDEVTTEDLFSQLWQDLSEEEKNQLMKNPNEVTLQVESGLELPLENEISRSALNGDTTQLDFLAANFSFSEHLKDWFGNATIPIELLPAEYFPQVEAQAEENDILEHISLSNVIENLSYNEQWDVIENILKKLQSEISLKMIQAEYEKLNEFEDFDGETNDSRASLVVNFYSTALINDFGKTLKDGAVLLTAGREKAYIIAGKWAHAGIFSKKEFLNKGGLDATHCVYTAQPDDAKKGPPEVIPDRPGYTCLDTIYMYTKQKRMAAILPKNYSVDKGERATNYAKTIFYDNKKKYFLPAWELIMPNFMSSIDTSHNGKSNYPYCSKVAYTAWKKVGVNLDAQTFAGCLVSPDDLYSSAFDRYRCITIRFFRWSKTWKYKTYSATSNVVREKSR